MAISIKDSVIDFLHKQSQSYSQRNLHLVVFTGYATNWGLALLDKFSEGFGHITVIIGDPKDIKPEKPGYGNTAIQFAQRPNVSLLTDRTQFMHIKGYLVLDRSTPLGFLTGSANLTKSGLEKSTEVMYETQPDAWADIVKKYHNIHRQCEDIKPQILDILEGGESSFARTTSADANYDSHSTGKSGWEIALTVITVFLLVSCRLMSWLLWFPLKFFFVMSKKGYAQIQYIYNYWRPSWIHSRLRSAVVFGLEIVFWTTILAIVAAAVSAIIINLSTLTDFFTDAGQTIGGIAGTIIGFAILAVVIALVGALYDSLGAVGGTVTLVLLIIAIMFVANQCGISL